MNIEQRAFFDTCFEQGVDPGTLIKCAWSFHDARRRRGARRYAQRRKNEINIKPPESPVFQTTTQKFRTNPTGIPDRFERITEWEWKDRETGNYYYDTRFGGANAIPLQVDPDATSRTDQELLANFERTTAFGDISPEEQAIRDKNISDIGVRDARHAKNHPWEKPPESQEELDARSTPVIVSRGKSLLADANSLYNNYKDKALTGMRNFYNNHTGAVLGAAALTPYLAYWLYRRRRQNKNR